MGEHGLEVEGLDLVAEQAAALLTDTPNPNLDFFRALSEAIAANGGDVAAELGRMGPDHPAALALRYWSPIHEEDLPRLACHDRLPRFLLRRYLQRDIAHRAIRNPQVDVEELEIAITHSDPRVRHSCAEHQRLPERLEMRLAQDPEPSVRIALGKRARDPQVIQLLAADEDYQVRAAVARHSQLEGDEAVTAIMKETSALVALQLLARLKPTPEQLARLARHKLAKVRAKLVPRITDVELLKQLAQDRNFSVRLKVANRPQLDQATLLAILEREESGSLQWLQVAIEVATHPSAPDDLIELCTARCHLPAIRTRLDSRLINGRPVPEAALRAFARKIEGLQNHEANLIRTSLLEIARRQKVDLSGHGL